MTTISGTHFTMEQLFADLKTDNVTDSWLCTRGVQFSRYGRQYKQKKQYVKAIAWFLLAATENNSWGIFEIGEMYHFGVGVPTNYLSALKWYLTYVKWGRISVPHKHIGILFEHGQGVPRDKYKAREWYRHHQTQELTDKNRFDRQGIYLSKEDKNKKLEQLIEETELIFESAKKKLEEKQFKTRKDIQTLEQLNIVCKLANGDMHSWDGKYILISEDNEKDTESVDESTINYEGEVRDLKDQIQLLEREKIAFENQTKQANAEIEQLKTAVAALEKSLKLKNVEASQATGNMVQVLNRLLESKSSELEKEKNENDALKREIELLKQERSSQQSAIPIYKIDR